MTNKKTITEQIKEFSEEALENMYEISLDISKKLSEEENDTVAEAIEELHVAHIAMQKLIDEKVKNH